MQYNGLFNHRLIRLDFYFFLLVACQYSKVNGKVAQNTLTLLLTLMRSIFCREGRRNEDSRILYETLETPCLLPDARKREERSSGMQTTNLTHGQYLIWLLLELSNTSLASGPEHKLVVSTLSSLFVVSASAKIFALENGFLESILEEVKDLHVKLNLASLQLENDNGDKRKVCSWLFTYVTIESPLDSDFRFSDFICPSIT